MARFDENPDDEYEHYACDVCKTGCVRLNETQTLWECDNCDFRVAAIKRNNTKLLRNVHGLIGDI